MIQIKFVIPVESTVTIEKVIAEQQSTQWIILHEKVDKSHFLCGFFNTYSEAKINWERIMNFLPKLPGSPEFHELLDRDWKEAYKDHFHPWNRKGIHFVPEWKKGSYPVPKGDQAIYLDPGMAFGTSDHPSTRLCLIALIDYSSLWDAEVENKSIIDAGCGSGILALTAAKLGYRNIFAFDNDPEAIRVSLENQAKNSPKESINFQLTDIETAMKERKGDFIFGNILSSILCRNAFSLLDSLSPTGILVLSGIQTVELKKTIEHFMGCIRKQMLNCRMHTSSIGEWASLIISRVFSRIRGFQDDVTLAFGEII